MPLTTAQVDRLGERLKAGQLTDEDRELLLEFRASFLPAYQEVVTKIRDGLSLDPTGRPEKTPESIVAKLRRGDIKHLADMQDIAGCRIVVDNRRDQDQLVHILQSLFAGARIVDRRKRPSFGYRAVHLIARAQGRQVEVQVRTSLQDRWANLVEDMSDLEGVDFKHGAEAPEGLWLRWLMLGAECIDQLARLEDPALLADMNASDLDHYRRGQFEAIILLAPYIEGQGK